jgi:hypothetical protein
MLDKKILYFTNPIIANLVDATPAEMWNLAACQLAHAVCRWTRIPVW